MRVPALSLAFVLCAISLAATATGAQEPGDGEAKEAPRTSGDHIVNCMRPLGHHAYQREFTCPIGGGKFKSLVLGTHSTYGRHLDWKPVSYMDLAAPVPVCPSNGFVMFKDEFSDEELSRYKTVIEGEKYSRIFRENHPSYYLLARLRELAGDKNENRWFQMVVATWEADACGSEKYAFYADEAIEAAKARLKSVEKFGDEYWVLNIIIPNLYRRTGRFDEAQAWLDTLDLEGLESLEEGGEYYKLAFTLLSEAVSENNDKRIPIEKPEDEKPKDQEDE
ncbi:MAG: hypothetical protein ACLFV8_12950 [Alphaproteobacteria bacterium]